jgi:hypothetical protein
LVKNKLYKEREKNKNLKTGLGTLQSSKLRFTKC